VCSHSFVILCDVARDAVASSVSSLALDSSRGLLYFTDTGSGTVGKLSTDGVGGGSPHLLIVGDNERPKAIAVDVTTRHTKYLSPYRAGFKCVEAPGMIIIRGPYAIIYVHLQL